VRTGVLVRATDVSGISGTGKVAELVEFSDGVVAVRWLGERQSTVIHESIENVEAIHGHNGATRIEWTSGGVA
jgi:hypothetical protein